MSKSRMFGDDEPENPNPSPRTTIVGGRPPEESAEAHPVPTGIQSLLRLAAEDAAFLRELADRRAEVAGAAGVELTESERMILEAIEEATLTGMVAAIPPSPAPRRDFLRKTAATAVLLLGGAALDGCESCKEKTPGESPAEQPVRPSKAQYVRGVKPDVPKPKPQPKPEPEAPAVKPSGQFAKPPPGWDGGTPEPPPEPKPERPDRPPKVKGIRPDRPHPTRGSRPDVPPRSRGED